MNPPSKGRGLKLFVTKETAKKAAAVAHLSNSANMNRPKKRFWSPAEARTTNPLKTTTGTEKHKAPVTADHHAAAIPLARSAPPTAANTKTIK